MRQKNYRACSKRGCAEQQACLLDACCMCLTSLTCTIFVSAHAHDVPADPQHWKACLLMSEGWVSSILGLMCRKSLHLSQPLVFLLLDIMYRLEPQHLWHNCLENQVKLIRWAQAIGGFHACCHIQASSGTMIRCLNITAVQSKVLPSFAVMPSGQNAQCARVMQSISAAAIKGKCYDKTYYNGNEEAYGKLTAKALAEAEAEITVSEIYGCVPFADKRGIKK
jgi:hypothetical protein